MCGSWYPAPRRATGTTAHLFKPLIPKVLRDFFTLGDRSRRVKRTRTHPTTPRNTPRHIPMARMLNEPRKIPIRVIVHQARRRLSLFPNSLLHLPNRNGNTMLHQLGLASTLRRRGSRPLCTRLVGAKLKVERQDAHKLTDWATCGNILLCVDAGCRGRFAADLKVMVPGRLAIVPCADVAVAVGRAAW